MGMGIGWTSVVWGWDGSCESMALRLRRRRQKARKAKRAMRPMPSMAAPMPMPAFAPVLRPELPVSVPLTGATVPLLELDDSVDVEVDVDVEEVVEPEVLEGEELEVDWIKEARVEVGVVDVNFEDGVVEGLLVVGAVVATSTVPGVYPGKRLIVSPALAGRLTWFDKVAEP